MRTVSSRFEGMSVDMFGIAMLGLGGLCLVAAAAAEHDEEVNESAKFSHDASRIKEKGLLKFKAETESSDITLECRDDIKRYAEKKISERKDIRNPTAVEIMFNIFRLKAILIILARKRFPLLIEFDDDASHLKYQSPLRLYFKLDDWAYRELVLYGHESSLKAKEIECAAMQRLNRVNEELSELNEGLMNELFDSNTDLAVKALESAATVPFLKDIKPVKDTAELILQSPVSKDFIWDEDIQKMFNADFNEIFISTKDKYDNNGNRILAIKNITQAIFKIMQGNPSKEAMEKNMQDIKEKYIPVTL